MAIDYNGIAAEYARHREVHPEVLKTLLSAGGIGSSSRVLEVGCGTGNYAVALENAAGCTCWGIDPSEQMLSRARARSSTIVFQPGKAEKLDFPSETLDLVFSVDVIHHVGNRLEYFQEAHRVLRKGGNLCTVTDSPEIIRRRQVLSVYFPETVDVELRRYPSIVELRKLMNQVGFCEPTEIVAEFAGCQADSQAFRDKAFSSLHLIPEEAFSRGIARLEQDLLVGPIPYVSRYLLLWGGK